MIPPSTERLLCAGSTSQSAVVRRSLLLATLWELVWPYDAAPKAQRLIGAGAVRMAAWLAALTVCLIRVIFISD